MADEPVGQIERDRIGRTGAGDTDGGNGTTATVLEDGAKPGATISNTARASGGTDHDGGRTAPGSATSSGSATVNWTRSPGASTAYGGPPALNRGNPVRPTRCQPPGDTVG